jgi:serine protease Do
MNENDYNRRSDWYAAQQSTVYSGKRSGKHKTLKIVMICVCALLVLCAGAYLLFGSSSGGGSKNSESSGDDSAQGQLPDDWQDYFDEYYGKGTAYTSAEIDLTKTDYTGSFSMSLDTSASQQLTLQQIYQKCIPSVVSITADEKNDEGTYLGTGIIMSSDGLIITNTHIIDGCDTAKVALYNGKEYDAKLIGADTQSDITILKIEATGLTPAQFGDSSQLKVGDSVVAIGNPLGENLTGTMTNGIVSAINRDIPYNGHTMTLIQTNAAINEGNSGGPLIDMYGRVVGITNMKMMSSYSSIEGIGFAIPTSGIKTVADQLLTGGGVTGRPSIGITVAAVSDIVSEHYKIPGGLYISAVAKGSDAEKQGVKKGDILTAVNGTAVTTTDDVNDIKNSLKVGDTIKLTVWRDDKTLDFNVKLVESSDIYGG